MASSASDFKKKKKATDLQLPSGNTALVKPIGMDKLLALGLIPDSLTPTAQSAVDKAKGKKEASTEEVAALMDTPDKMAEMFRSFDRITVAVVKEPATYWHMREIEDSEPAAFEEIPEDERDEDFLYTDEVDMEDKMFIFQFVVGGTRDLETFRREFGESLASMDGSKDVESSSV